MDWVNLHLMVNHFPIILGVAGALAGIAALLARSPAIWKYAGVTVLLAGLTSPAAYISGSRAEEVVEDAWYVRHGEVEEHEELGLYALIALLAAGVAAAVSLWKPGPATRGVLVALSVVAVVVTAACALEGGEIVHESPALEQARAPARRPGA
ncbi:MAG TPA: hypothetical protein VF158_02605 [Longimicrobiales bacterium]